MVQGGKYFHHRGEVGTGGEMLSRLYTAMACLIPFFFSNAFSKFFG